MSGDGRSACGIIGVCHSSIAVFMRTRSARPRLIMLMYSCPNPKIICAFYLKLICLELELISVRLELRFVPFGYKVIDLLYVRYLVKFLSSYNSSRVLRMYGHD